MTRMKNMLYKQLQDAGLNENEAKIYVASLELGQTSVSRIAKKSGIKRTTVYLSLENLMQKGLISAIKKDGKAHYYAEDPRNLERIMAEKKERISKMIPELLAFTNLIDRKPGTRYFEGEEGIREVLMDTLNSAEQEILTMYSESYIYDFDEKFFSEYFIPERMKKKIFTRALLPDNEQMRAISALDEASFKKSRFIAEDLFKIKIEIMIYGKDKISIISFKEKFALIIESPVIFDSFKSIFETMWAGAK
ncbi:MAG: Transcriptional regulator TrmB [Candidatus Moranbacteria bacterium GW2011_GWA2_39_41]|nr:MAG: Transcriptional regulator TrmB [Candidatus Moranbacteria bacterium GW2011_GWA2_39_41]